MDASNIDKADGWFKKDVKLFDRKSLWNRLKLRLNDPENDPDAHIIALALRSKLRFGANAVLATSSRH